MKKAQTRKEKIELLKALRDGRITPGALADGKVFFIVGDPVRGIYKSEGFSTPPIPVMNQEQYNDFLNKIEQHNKSVPQFSRHVIFYFEEILTYENEP